MADSMTQVPENKEHIMEVLNRAFSQRYQSVAQYILDASPYVRESDAPLLRVIQEIAAFDRFEAEHLADIIEGLEGVPMVIPYDHEIAELNYLSLGFLRGVLKARLEKELAEIDRTMNQVQGCPEANTALLGLRKALQSQIEQLASA